MANPAEWRVERLAGALGAEISAIDLRSIVEGDAADVAAIKALLLEHKVLFFPGQALSVDEHIAFGKRFGTIESHPHLKNPFTDNNEVFELAASRGGVADEWHTDITFQKNPSILSILKMVKCPSVGGDTMWTNLNQAFNELSPPLQALCEGLSALHDAHPHGHPEKMAVHPVVRVHPETNEKALFVNEHFTRRLVELSASESRVLLDYLTEWVKNPRFTVRYRWTAGTIAIWDNRCTQHFVLNDFEGERVIQRVTVVGDVVEAAAPSSWQPWTRQGRASAATRHDRQLNQYLRENESATSE